MISYTCEHEYHGKGVVTQLFRDDQGEPLSPEDLATLWKVEYDRATTAFDEIPQYHTRLEAFHKADTPSYYPAGDRKITIHHLSLLTEAKYRDLFPAKKPEYGTTEDPNVDKYVMVKSPADICTGDPSSSFGISSTLILPPNIWQTYHQRSRER